MGIQQQVKEFANVESNNDKLEASELKLLEDHVQSRVKLKQLKKEVEGNPELIGFFNTPDFKNKVKNLREKNPDDLTKSDKAFITIAEYTGSKQESTFKDTEKRETLELELNQKIVELTEEINKGDYSSIQKEALIAVLNDLSEEVDSVAELEERFDTSSGTIDGVNDLIEGIYNTLDSTGDFIKYVTIIGPKETIDSFVKAGIDFGDAAKKTWNIAIENSIATIDDAKVWINETYQDTKQSTVDGYYKMIELGITSKDKITEYIIKSGENINEWGMKLVENGLAEWSEFTDLLIEGGQNVKEWGMKLIENGLATWGDFMSFLSQKADLLKEIGVDVADFIAESIKSGLATADQVLNRCGEKIKEGAANIKEFTKLIIGTLVYMGDVAVNTILTGLSVAMGGTLLAANFVWEAIMKPTIEFGVGLAIKTGELASTIFDRMKAEGQDIKAWGIQLIENGLAEWGDFTDLLIEKGQNIKSWGLALVESGKIAFGDFMTYLGGKAELLQKMGLDIAAFITEAISSGLATTEQVLNRCGEKIKEGAANIKEFTKLIIGTLVYMGDVAVNTILTGLSVAMGGTLLAANFVWEAIMKPTIEFGVGLAIKTGELASTIVDRMKLKATTVAEFVEESRDFLSKTTNMRIHKALDIIKESAGQAKDVFLTLYKLGKIRFEYLANWLNKGFEKITDTFNAIIEWGLAYGGSIYNKAIKRLTSKYTTVADSVKREILGTINRLLDAKKIVFNSIAEIYGSVKNFCNELIKTGLMNVGEVFDFLNIQLGNGIDVCKMMLESGLATREQGAERMHKTGEKIQIIAKTLMEYGKIGVYQLADKLFELSGRLKENIGEIIDGIMEGVKQVGDKMRNWAFDKYSEFMNDVDAAKKALMEMDAWIGEGISKLGDWLLSAGLTIKDAGKILILNSKGHIKEAVIRMANQFDNGIAAIDEIYDITKEAFQEMGQNINDVRLDIVTEIRDTQNVGKEALDWE